MSNEHEAPVGDGPHRQLRSTCAIAVMAKASIAGTTKTRLVPPLTPAEAAMLNTVFLQDAADNILSASRLADISGWMAYTPAGSEPFFRAHLPQSIGLMETVAPTLGECLLQAVSALLRAGHDSVCLINSDSPTLPVDYLATAAALLSAPGDRVVLGPAIDGGYYLIGMKRPHSGLFDGIPWSTDQVLERTLARADSLDISVAKLPLWYDVDDVEALQTLVGEILDDRPFGEACSSPSASWTGGYLRKLVRDSGLRERLCATRAVGGLAQ